jgi:L-fucose isomerase
MASAAHNSRGIKIGILTFGDGRDFLQKPLAEVNSRFLKQLVDQLTNDGFEVVTGREVVWQNEIAVREARELAAQQVDAVVFNFSVWAWPQYARMAAQFLPQPIVMFANVNPQFPGLVGMLANAGSLDQVGIPFYKTFGDISQESTLAKLRSRLLAV